MINLHDELNRLKFTMLNHGMPAIEADAILDLAAKDMSIAIMNLVADAMKEAEMLGIQQGADRFIIELTAVEINGTFQIATESGQTDFSTLPMPMLPRLLKNAKTSKDGSRYKVIPMPPKGNKVASNSLDAQLRIDQSRREAMQEWQQDFSQQKALNPTILANRFSGLASAKAIVDRNNMLLAKKQQRTTGAIANPDFKTASDKQDPSKSWVIPGKDLDMGPILQDINYRLQGNIDNVVVSIIREYERLL